MITFVIYDTCREKESKIAKKHLRIKMKYFSRIRVFIVTLLKEDLNDEH